MDVKEAEEIAGNGKYPKTMSGDSEYWQALGYLERVSQEKAIFGPVVEALEKALEHSCEIGDADEAAEFGVFPCCNKRDYSGHSESCYLRKAVESYRRQEGL